MRSDDNRTQAYRSLHDRLSDALCRSPAYRAFVLLDPNHPVAAGHPLHIEQLENRAGEALTAIPRADASHDRSRWPRLLALSGTQGRSELDDALLSASWRCADERKASVHGAYVSGWIVSDASADTLADGIGQRLVFSRGGKKVLLPLFEPYRLALAMSTLESALWTAWLGRIRGWFFLDAAGRLRATGPMETERASRLPPPSGAFPAAFWQAQDRVHQGQRVLNALMKSGAALPEEYEQRIHRALEKAEARGLRHKEDTEVYALNELTLFPDWHRHPAVQQCVADAAAGKGRLASLMAALPDSVRKALVGEPRPGVPGIKTSKEHS
ncbi:hypothetical protein [Alloalcanivorax xenomutans]|uniref:hypothetical protein n=1 Tax=Alloalcanivorax xenomutans TaxID=1094342 RepID=UPI001F349D9A|nr:hypothetical protein [Alloalcanivorax xenomutans]MCE7525098.1 hypothetical protein [Alloalcanivorax xenomutans]